jgi:hypothetical protein
MSPQIQQTLFRFFACALVCAGLVSAPALQAASEPATQRVSFKKGSSSAIVQGRIVGEQTVDYILGAKAGQLMNVSLGTKHGATYFNILAPGEKQVAMFNGSVSQNQFEGVLPATGEYRIRVYMLRAAARRNETANYRLEMIIAAAALAAPTAASGAAKSVDAKVAGTEFQATGNIACSLGTKQVAASCSFGVKRQSAGNAMVTITQPDQTKREIVFAKGRATGYNKTGSNAGAFKADKKSDTHIIQIGDERYEIPDAVISGG